ncbi:septal ring factor EnvC (AmiA/AmiB activator) [Agrobacterium vitis]|nr:septal ring factor EnvC (AmiA/AmiB activator) [Agrobacterium vitis]MBE1439621.1 septal ring factor EnvC (AmiA/AmiB activator) [Agrobacterium vitis]
MNRYIIAGLAILALIALIVWGAVASLGKVESMVAAGAAAARNERDAHWRAEIEKSNADAQAKLAETLKSTMAAQDAARDQLAALERRATELEKDNDSLPENGRFGLSRSRVRLLNGQ